MKWIFNRNGQAGALDNDDCIYSRNGKFRLWVSGNNLYDTNGKHVGWVENGVYYDHNNDCLLYTSPSQRDRQKSRMPSSA